MQFISFDSKTVDILINESGCVLEHEQASNFRELIMSGKWTEVRIDHPLKSLIYFRV